ncbi:uncharacterized protein LOC126833890 isoform X3 [Adelges cooleyi]|uniref:uncharacterized protein LOC126833890 isoform X3 n=1 Tax=Adelges cooleyi TaxID=133065 RepID=UPI00217FF2EC|nr:uncharacterized protein LOC126833890 isoform X3 [Adelges cooleyi]
MALKRTIGFHLNEQNQRKKTNLFQAIKNEDMTLEELKADCLIQLLSMSKKRVLATLNGRDLELSSDSDDTLVISKNKRLQHNTSSMVKRSQKEKKKKSLKKKRNGSSSDSDKPAIKEGKTLLEILELEMRAKAIRALLGPEEKPKENKIEVTPINKTVSEDKSEVKSWNESYMERNNVNDVVKTSKLCTGIRRRMLLHQQKLLAEKEKLKADEPEHVSPGDIIKAKSDEKLKKMLSNIGKNI